MTRHDPANYADEVDASHVGRRVSIRRWVDDDGTQRPSDVVGDLQDADEVSFTVRRRSGEVVLVDRATVLGSRLLPPAVQRPARDRDRG